VDIMNPKKLTCRGFFGVPCSNCCPLIPHITGQAQMWRQSSHILSLLIQEALILYSNCSLWRELPGSLSWVGWMWLDSIIASKWLPCNPPSTQIRLIEPLRLNHTFHLPWHQQIDSGLIHSWSRIVERLIINLAINSGVSYLICL
jgi:hypothetical protein